MTKRTSKTRAPKKPRGKGKAGVDDKPKVGGARQGSGPKPKLGEGHVRTVIKTVRLSTDEHESQLAAVKRGGSKDWAEWARPILNTAADERVKITVGTGIIEVKPEQTVPDLRAGGGDDALEGPA